jgi:beta-phosphoglucomutase
VTRFKAIIFDMDGTILESSGVWQNAYAQFVRDRGVDYTPEVAMLLGSKLHGVGLDATIEILKTHFLFSGTVEQLKIEMERIIEYEQQSNGTELITGFAEFHRQVVAHGLQNAVATNTNTPALKRFTQKAGLDTFFGKHLYSIDDVGKGKPSPDIFLYAAKQLGVEPSECIVIEDSPVGIQAAVAAKMFCIGINTGGDRGSLYQADLIIEGYHEIDLPGLLRDGSD